MFSAIRKNIRSLHYIILKVMDNDTQLNFFTSSDVSTSVLLRSNYVGVGGGGGLESESTGFSDRDHGLGGSDYRPARHSSH